MTGALSEHDIHAAVRRKLGPGTPLDALRIEEMHRSRCTVTRLTETREPEQCWKYGLPPDRLDGLEEYDDLNAVPLDPPRDVNDRLTKVLLLRNSVKNVPCACGDGKRRCRHCTEGRLPCEETVTCTECHDTTAACDHCGGKQADRDWTPVRRAPDDRRKRKRVKCRRCHTPQAACATCAGDGCTECTKCTDGFRPCTKCNATGEVTCGDCDGRRSKSYWTEGRIRRVPTEQPPTERPCEHPPRRARKQIEHGTWSSSLLHDPDEPFEPMLNESHRSALDRCRAAKKPTGKDTELLRQVRFEQLALYRVTCVRRPHREYYVFRAQDGVRAVSVMPEHRRKLLLWAVLISGMLTLAALVLVLR
ncbi:hypothetical protein [Streptomyces sp. NPDC054863]